MRADDVSTTPRSRLTGADRRKIWERERGHCMLCRVKLQVGSFVFEHVRALELGGEDTPENIRLTCRGYATEKTRADHAMAGKAKRQKEAAYGFRESRHPLPCGRRSPWKRTIDGRTIRREP